jgi:hypothetical protein
MKRFPEELSGQKSEKGINRQGNFALSERDVMLITNLSEYLGCSRSEAVRTAVRHFAAHIGAMEGRRLDR